MGQQQQQLLRQCSTAGLSLGIACTLAVRQHTCMPPFASCQRRPGFCEPAAPIPPLSAVLLQEVWAETKAAGEPVSQLMHWSGRIASSPAHFPADAPAAGHAGQLTLHHAPLTNPPRPPHLWT